SNIPFGTRGSQDQILPLRPVISDTYGYCLPDIRNDLRNEIGSLRRSSWRGQTAGAPVGEGVSKLRIHHGARVTGLFRAASSSVGDPALRRRQVLAGRRYQEGQAVGERTGGLSDGQDPSLRFGR